MGAFTMLHNHASVCVRNKVHLFPLHLEIPKRLLTPLLYCHRDTRFVVEAVVF